MPESLSSLQLCSTSCPEASFPLPPWTPIVIVTRQVVDVIGDQVTIEFGISPAAPPTWVEAFNKNAAEDVVGDPGPIANSQSIRWTVDESTMEDTVRYVEQHVRYANQALAEHVDNSRRAAQEAAQAEHDHQARIRELQVRLNEIDRD